MTTEEEIDQLAKKLWDYGQMHHQLKPADAILVFGSYNPIVGERAAELFLQGYAPIVVFSGNRSDSTTTWKKTEAETIADVAIATGLPKKHILLETKAKNSGENVQFSKALLAKHHITPKRIIVIQKPYAERRAFATVRKQWPEVEVQVTSPQLTYEQYVANTDRDKKRIINTIVGDIQRIKAYADQGFQIPQEMPDDVWSAFEHLVDLGYNKWVI